MRGAAGSLRAVGSGIGRITNVVQHAEIVVQVAAKNWRGDAVLKIAASPTPSGANRQQQRVGAGVRQPAGFPLHCCTDVITAVPASSANDAAGEGGVVGEIGADMPGGWYRANVRCEY